MKNTHFFQTSEQTCWNKLQKLNEKHHYFVTLDQTSNGEKPTHWDASGVTSDGRKVLIELKNRNAVLTPTATVSGKNFQADTILIEQGKVAVLLMEHNINGFTPLYINFLADGNVLIYNLLHLSGYKTLEFGNVTNNGYGGVETNARRLGLYIKDAKVVIA